MSTSYQDRERGEASSTRASQGPMLTDDQIVKGVLCGSPTATDALYDRCHLAVERSVLRVLRSRDNDFEDLVQLAFERVLRSIHREQFTGTFSLARWASSIATHASIDVLRARLRERQRIHVGQGDDNVIPLFGANVEHHLEARSEVERVYKVLEKMPKNQAEALMLHDVYGHELEEVAAVLGISVAAAQSRALRGRKELYRRLGIGNTGDAL